MKPRVPRLTLRVPPWRPRLRVGRRTRHTETPPVPTRATPVPARPGRVPWWVRCLTSAGRPVVAVVVLVMCAPGEHHLARLAGWDGRLAWGMAGVLAAYAGIAAAVASARPKGAPGKRSAVVGAWLSLGAAMAAQPVSHMFVTDHLTAEPRPPVWLVVAVSCVPPLVLGHLLHLAATPVAPMPTATRNETAPEPRETPQPDETPTGETAEQETRDLAMARYSAAVRANGAFPTRVPDPDHAETPPETTEHHDEPDPGRRLLTTREVADRHGVSVSTVRTWKDRGRITPAVTDQVLGNLYDPETLPETDTP